jgi:predicted DNA repair protein MutK
MNLHIPTCVVIFLALMASYANGLFSADFVRETPMVFKVVHGAFNGLVLAAVAALLSILAERGG